MSNIKIARIVTVSLSIVVVGLGLVGELRYGGICSVGAWQIWATCPLGYVERSLAARQLMPQWQTVALVVFLIILFGRVFCAWICPTVLLRRIFTMNGRLKPRLQAAPTGTKWDAYSPYAVLAGLLVASYIFRFPVFCLFCPVGLFFGFLFAAVRLFGPATLSLELFLFPLMLVIELYVLKSWCRTICPLGAMLSIAGNFNRFFLPAVNKEKCLTSKGAKCGACARACPEGINLLDTSTHYTPNSCTKCFECYEKCPTKAIKLAVFK